MTFTTKQQAILLTCLVSGQGIEQVTAVLVNSATSIVLHRLTRWSKRGAVSDMASWAVGKQVEIIQVA